MLFSVCCTLVHTILEQVQLFIYLKVSPYHDHWKWRYVVVTKMLVINKLRQFKTEAVTCDSPQIKRCLSLAFEILNKQYFTKRKAYIIKGFLGK